MPSIARQITRFAKTEVDYLFQHARCIFRNKLFTILSAPAQQSIGRILIITSKKVGNAPQRNKIRRQIKSLFYEEKLYELPYDYAIIVQKQAIELSYSDLKALLLKVVTQRTDNHAIIE